MGQPKTLACSDPAAIRSALPASLRRTTDSPARFDGLAADRYLAVTRVPWLATRFGAADYVTRLVLRRRWAVELPYPILAAATTLAPAIGSYHLHRRCRCGGMIDDQRRRGRNE